MAESVGAGWSYLRGWLVLHNDDIPTSASDNIKRPKLFSLLPSIYLDESSLSYTSRSIYSRGYVSVDNEEYWADISIYGKFKYTSVSSLEKSKITSIYFSVDELGGYSIRDFSLKVREFLGDPNDVWNRLLSKRNYITGTNYDD